MRVLALGLVAATGCNLAFTASPDPDAPGEIIDPKKCPGRDTAPVFGGSMVDVAPSTCISYSLSAAGDLALVDCAGMINQGSMEGGFAPVLFVSDPGDLAVPKITPEGDEMFVRAGSRAPIIDIYKKVAVATWRFTATTGVSGDADMSFSAPSSRSSGRRIIIATATLSPPQFDEYVATGTTWMFERTHTADMLGVAQMRQPDLTPDGLHLVFSGSVDSGETSIFYVSRSSVEEQFTTASPLALKVTNPQWPHMTSDCARLYIDGEMQLTYITR